MRIKNAESYSVSTVNTLPFHPPFSFSSLIADAIMGSCTFLDLRYTVTFRT